MKLMTHVKLLAIALVLVLSCEDRPGIDAADQKQRTFALSVPLEAPLGLLTTHFPPFAGPDLHPTPQPGIKPKLTSAKPITVTGASLASRQ